MPVLIIHGRHDRSAPYGGARDWALRLPNARLLTVKDAAHAPWIEASDEVLSSVEVFLGGAWPGTAEKVDSLDPLAEP
jgi:pimeloyl-ACP methyl ester carboxylesterase